MKRITVLIFSAAVLFSCFTGCAQKEIADGVYKINAEITGGTGRSTIESAEAEIEDGNVTATIVWSSPFYEYMIVDGVRYEPVQESGNAVFKIPAVLDEKMSVSASTAAMSRPYLIEYTLYFDSTTLERK